MNCQQGDLALVIAGPDTGKAVTCLEALPPGWERDDLPPGTHQSIHESVGPLWRVDRHMNWGDASLRVAPDWALMPITPGTPEPQIEQEDVT